MERSSRLAVVAAAAVTTAGYAWWATSLRPFTSAALVGTAAGGVAAVGVGAVLPAPPAPSPPARRGRGAGVWIVLVGALAAWELASFFELPRSQHPTLSSLANDVLSNHPTRALAMVVWLVAGARIVRR